MKLHTIDYQAAKAFFEGGGRTISVCYNTNSTFVLFYCVSIEKMFTDDFIVKINEDIIYQGNDLEQAVKAYNEA